MTNKLILSFFLLILFKSSFAQSNLYGLTAGGGDGFGTVFKTAGNGTNIQTLNTFTPNVPGIASTYNNKLCKTSTGKLYGIANSGGVYGGGVIFEYDEINNIYTVKYNFKQSTGNLPSCYLIEGSNGKLYGTTYVGGATNWGTIFEFDITNNVYTKLHDFIFTSGGRPYAGVFEASNGKLYGTTAFGGANAKGVLFEYDLSTNTYTKKLDFTTTSGYTSYGSFVELAGGKLYGLAANGGVSGLGVIFEYDINSGVYTKKIDLSSINGSNPYSTLFQATNGKLYGMTNSGGNWSLGTIFEYDAGLNTYTKKISLSSLTSSGSGSYGSLMQASNGKLYGATTIGGVNNKGVLFEYDITTNTYQKKIDLTTQDGINLNGSLTETANGKLYGIASKGGTENSGVILEYDINTNTYSKKIDLNSNPCSVPLGSLMQAANGKIYGLTSHSGTNKVGSLFEYDPATDVFTKKIEMDSSGGYGSLGPLIQATNGKLYGTTAIGGVAFQGVLFEYDINSNTYTKKVDLNLVGGVYPMGALMQATNGKLYGTTYIGGGNGMGSIYEYDIINDTCILKYSFNATTGTQPSCALIQASNGKLYGTTRVGGTNSAGTIFEYDIITNTCTTKIDLTVASGSIPYGALTEAPNGMLYGLTSEGGANNVGAIFEYDINTNTYTKKFDFNATDGTTPQGSFLLASNGLLYGATNTGGIYSLGVVFEYNHNTNTYTKTSDFNGFNGANPGMAGLIEIPSTITVLENLKEDINITALPNPFSNEIKIQLTSKVKNAFVTIYNNLGQIVFKKNINSEDSSCELEILPRGIYIVRVENDFRFKTIKLLKE